MSMLIGRQGRYLFESPETEYCDDETEAEEIAYNKM